MSLQLSKLERVVESADGGKQARCPACAELGHDRKGEHLRIYADGRFGCCVHPKDREHRKRIFALAGDREPKTIRVKVANVKTRATVQTDVLGRLGRLFESQNGNTSTNADHLGTLGTPFSYLRAHAREDDHYIPKLKEFETSVPSVPSDEPDFDCDEPVPSVPASSTPYLLADGTLVIPFGSPERFHWWKGGQSIAQPAQNFCQHNMQERNSMALPFEQQPKESVKAFQAFSLYLNFGPARSLAAVARQLGKSEGLIERWSRHHHWGERIDEHGKHIAVLTRRAEVQVVNEFALERAKRNAAQEESEWQTRCELLALAREKIQEWRATPKKLGTLEGIARLLELASKLGRLSCGMATDKTERTVEETHTVSVDFEIALKKIYGTPLPGEVVDVEAQPVAVETPMKEGQ